MPDFELIGDYLVCQKKDKNPISLRRVSEEIVCLGYDKNAKRIVELHVIGDTEQMRGNGKASFLERSWNAATLQSHCFQKVLGAADDDGIFFYATDVNEGEFLTDYIVRTGPVATETATAMTLDLIDSLVEVEPHYRLLLGIQLKNLMVVLENSAYLNLRIIDLGLARPEPRGMNYFETTDLLADVSRQFYYLLSGRPYTIGKPGQVESLQDIDPLVKKLLADTIESEGTQSVETFERYQELLESAYTKGTDNLPRRSAIAATPKTRPRSTLQREIFDQVDVKNQLHAASFSFETESAAFEYPYAVTATRSGSGERGRLAWVPPRSVYAFPPQDAGLILLNSFYYRFLTSTTGVSLQEFLILRNHRPSAVDVILLLNGLASKIDSGSVSDRAFSHHQIWFNLSGKTQAEIVETAKQGVDQWPSVNVRILPESETAVLLSPPAAAKEAEPIQLAMSFLDVARELLCEAPESIHDWLDSESLTTRSKGEKCSCNELLLKIADNLDDLP